MSTPREFAEERASARLRVRGLDTRHYRIPLPETLSDSIHGDMPEFELVTVRVATDQGLEGLGYTYTVGRGGAAIRALIHHDLAPLVAGVDPRAVEQAWDRMWWGINWVGRDSPRKWRARHRDYWRRRREDRPEVA